MKDSHKNKRELKNLNPEKYLEKMKSDECKGKHECIKCGQYIFDEDIDWIIKRFENVERKIELLDNEVEQFLKLIRK
jgi:hypothetical protein